MIYWLWLSFKARSLTFFTASNPGIFMGGMLGESKYDVLKLVPDEIVARTSRLPKNSTKEQVLTEMARLGLAFPVIFKPDIGERGFLVKRINREEQIEEYLQRVKVSFLIQEYLDLPLECGIFYTRFPNETTGKVTSVVIKEMLTITGDGESNLQELILAKDRAKLQWDILKERFRDRLEEVPTKDKVILLNEIGNHCLGTKFLNGESLINENLSRVFDKLSQRIEGFYFGRFDLRAASVEDLYSGNFKVMELNGCGAEPAHIYEPGFPLLKALRVQFTHWKNLYTISKENHNRGVNYVPMKEAIRVFKEFRRVMK